MKNFNIKEILFKPIYIKANKKHLSIFLSQLGALISSGIVPSKAIYILKDQQEIKSLNYSLNNIYIDINNGEMLSSAFSKYRVYDDFFIAMLKTGEESGKLGDICSRLSEYYENEDSTNKKIKSAMMYPIILLITTVVVLIFIFKNVMPVYISLFESSNMVLPVLTKILIKISVFIGDNFLLLVLVFISLIAIYILGRKNNGFKKKIDYIKMKFPVIGKNYIKILTSRLSRAMAISYSSGVNFIESLKIIANGINNLYFKEKLLESIRDIVEGYSISQSFDNTNILPQLFNSMVEVGEETGKLGGILEITSDYYKKESDYAIEYLLKLFEPIMIIVMAIFVGLIVIAIALPMFDLVNSYAY